MWPHLWPVVSELQRHLDEGVRTQLVLFGKLFAEFLEVEHVYIKIVDQSIGNLKQLIVIDCKLHHFELYNFNPMIFLEEMTKTNIPDILCISISYTSQLLCACVCMIDIYTHTLYKFLQFLSAFSLIYIFCFNIFEAVYAIFGAWRVSQSDEHVPSNCKTFYNLLLKKQFW